MTLHTSEDSVKIVYDLRFKCTFFVWILLSVVYSPLSLRFGAIEMTASSINVVAVVVILVCACFLPCFV